MIKNKQHNDLVLQALGDAIRSRRVDLQLTQQEVAAASRLHRSYVTDIENGLRNLSFLTLTRVVESLHCPLSLVIIDKEKILEEILKGS